MPSAAAFSATRCATAALRRRPAMVVNSAGTAATKNASPSRSSCTATTSASHWYGRDMPLRSSKMGLGLWQATWSGDGVAKTSLMASQKGVVSLVAWWKLNIPGPSVVPAANA